MYRSLTLIYIVLAAFLLFAGVGKAQGVVLCLGADGHLELEFAQDGACTQFIFQDHTQDHGAKDTHKHPISAAVDLESHCDSCIDIPIGHETAVNTPYLNAPLTSFTQTLHWCGTTTTCTNAPAEAAPLPPRYIPRDYLPPAHLNLVHTTILRL